MQLGQGRPYGPFSAVLSLVLLPFPFHKSLRKLQMEEAGWGEGLAGCAGSLAWLAPELGETWGCFQAEGVALCSK